MNFYRRENQEAWEALQVELLREQVNKAREEARSLKLLNDISERTSPGYRFPNPSVNYKTQATVSLT